MLSHKENFFRDRHLILIVSFKTRASNKTINQLKYRIIIKQLISLPCNKGNDFNFDSFYIQFIAAKDP